MTLSARLQSSFRSVTPASVRSTSVDDFKCRSSWIHNAEIENWSLADLRFQVRRHPGRGAYAVQALGKVPRRIPLKMGAAPGAEVFGKFGSPGRIRTSDPAVNSRLLYLLSYRGAERASVKRS